VSALARRLNISPCIIAGRLRHEHGDHSLFGKCFREKVKGKLQGATYLQ
jgi:HTH-type transcriptional regulator/antitoxin HigA